MSDTIGFLIDKLFTVDSKMWNNQEMLYEIRRNDYEWFKHRFLETDATKLELYKILKKCCDLNVQRTLLITEIDSRLVQLVEDGLAGKDLQSPSNVFNSHKTY
jgi:hypothetical protein